MMLFKMNTGRPSLQNGPDQLIVTQYTLSIYPSIHKKLIRTIFDTHIVFNNAPLQSCPRAAERRRPGRSPPRWTWPAGCCPAIDR